MLKHPAFRTTIAILIGAGALYLAFRKQHLHRLFADLGGANLWIIIAGTGVMFLSHLVRAWRYKNVFACDCATSTPVIPVFVPSSLVMRRIISFPAAAMSFVPFSSRSARKFPFLLPSLDFSSSGLPI